MEKHLPSSGSPPKILLSRWKIILVQGGLFQERRGIFFKISNLESLCFYANTFGNCWQMSSFVDKNIGDLSWFESLSKSRIKAQLQMRIGKQNWTGCLILTNSVFCFSCWYHVSHFFVLNGYPDIKAEQYKAYFDPFESPLLSLTPCKLNLSQII